MIFENYESIFGYLVGLLGRGISPSQGHYLQRRAQHRKAPTHIHPSSGIRTHDPSIREFENRTCLSPRGYWDRLAWKKILVFSYVGRPPWRMDGTAMYRGHTVCVCVMCTFVLLCVCLSCFYAGCARSTWRFLKFKNQLARYSTLPYWQSSCTVLFGV
jgi:hypothetical protein